MIFRLLHKRARKPIAESLQHSHSMWMWLLKKLGMATEKRIIRCLQKKCKEGEEVYTMMRSSNPGEIVAFIGQKRYFN